jgi:hypothetical protein
LSVKIKANSVKTGRKEKVMDKAAKATMIVRPPKSFHIDRTAPNYGRPDGKSGFFVS